MPIDVPADAVSFERLGSELRVTLTGEVDIETTQNVPEDLYRHAAEAEAVVVNLATVTFLDSTGLTVLLRLRNEAHPNPVRLLDVDPRVVRTFYAAGVAEMFDLS